MVPWEAHDQGLIRPQEASDPSSFQFNMYELTEASGNRPLSVLGLFLFQVGFNTLRQGCQSGSDCILCWR